MRSLRLLVPLRNVQFRRYWTGSVVSQLGDFALFVALPFYVYTLTGSVVSTGAVFVVQTVPQVVLAPLAGTLIDRWDARRVVIFCNAGQALVLLSLLAVHGSGEIWIVYLVALLESVGTVFTAPAAGVLVHTIVEPEVLVSANAIEALGIDLARLLGPPVGGLLFGAGGLFTVVVVDAATFGFAAAAAWAMGRSAGKEAPSEPVAAAEGTAVHRIVREIGSGMATVAGDRPLRLIFSVVAFVFVGQGLLNVMLVPLVRHHLGGSATDLGLILTGQAVGGILGGLVAGSIQVRPGRMVAGGCLGIGVAISGLANSPTLIVGMACMAVAGVGAMAVLVGLTTILQGSTPPSHLGRVFALFSAWLSLFTLAGVGLATGVGQEVGSVSLLDIAAALIALGGVVAMRLTRTPGPLVPE
ncbi:MAG TPA: MFS transporter [Candidatus Dormibacteraeota bacterium]|nr:MFS transporter [Candidatus Dormibacteraeota bacterium]